MHQILIEKEQVGLKDKMKNKKSILIGIILAILFILFFNGVFQYLLLLLFNANIEKFEFSMLGFFPTVQLKENINIYINTFFLLLPIIISIIFIELSFTLLNKLPLGVLRYSAIIFILVVMGDVIVFTFYGAIQLLLNPLSNSLWSKLISLWQLSGGKIYVLIFFIILVLFAYLQLLQKRLMKFIVIPKKEIS